MILSRWKIAISQRCIFQTEDGRIFAFPFAPFVAYLLPDAKSQSLVENALLWRAIGSIPIAVATIAVIKMYGLPVDVLLWLIVLDYLVFILIVCLITRKCVRLPIWLSFRACAAVQDPATLWETSYRFTSATVLFTLPLFFLPINPVWYAVPICTFLRALVTWYMVILRHKDRTVPDSFPDQLE